MRDIPRLQTEIKLLERNYNADDVIWPSDFNWIFIKNFALPKKYNMPKCQLLVLVPDQYMPGIKYQDIFIPNGILVFHGGQWVLLPHYYHRFPYLTLEDKFVNDLIKRQWSYLCIHPKKWNQNDTIFTFINMVYTFLCEPFREWDKN